MEAQALHIPMRPHDGDIGPYSIVEVRTVWIPIARTIDVLHGLGACTCDAITAFAGLRVDEAMGETETNLPAIALAIRLLSAQEGMHAIDWLRMRAVEERMPRRKPPAAADLQVRLKGLQCRRLVAQLEPETNTYRVTIKNLRGDVASVSSSSFVAALEGAIRMAGARVEDP